MLFTGEIDSEFVSKHGLEMNGYLQRAIHILNLRLQSFLLTSTGRDFDSMYSESFSFASTAKCDSMAELFPSTGRGFDSSIIAIFSFASTGKCNSMVELFASTGSRITRTVPDHKNPGYQKRNRLRMSPILYPTNFADFAPFYKIVCCLAMARQQ